jgi:hypothetical protein
MSADVLAREEGIELVDRHPNHVVRGHSGLEGGHVELVAFGELPGLFGGDESSREVANRPQSPALGAILCRGQRVIWPVFTAATNPVHGRPRIGPAGFLLSRTAPEGCSSIHAPSPWLRADFRQRGSN